jgi:uncharacterized membrane protein YphA (DoxX/SURF4 family)
MKHVFLFARLFTGALFIFSGIVKLNDPSGFAIKLNEYFDVFAEDVSTKQDSVNATIRCNDVLLIKKNYELYASDDIKDIQIKIEGDSFIKSTTLKWGGSGIANEETKRIVFPARIEIDITGKDGKSIGHQFVIDSLLNGTLSHTEDLAMDISPWVKDESLLSLFFKGCKEYSLYFSGFFCALEVILGFAMLIGWQFKMTILITALLIGFFTFLTWYSAYFNKVTDCGCFGDFIKLKPWDSFKKDIVLSVLVVILVVGRKFNKSFFVESKSHVVMAVFSVLTTLFGWFCYTYLPVWDFLPYKKGNDIKHIMTFIPDGERETDSIRIRFMMKKENDSLLVSTAQYAEFSERGYQFVRQDREIIIPGYESPIHDFAIYDAQSGEDFKNKMLDHDGPQLVFVIPFLSEVNTNALPDAEACFKWAQKNKIPFWGLTSASLDASNTFKLEHKINFKLFSADQKMLMTMARYNPTLYLFDGSTVVEKWSGASMPNAQTLNSLVSSR